jgi:two-component system response regulator RegA
METDRELLLIVEDHEGMRDTLRRLLKGRGWSVRTASTVDEGLALPLAEPGCVVLDLTLPDGGESALRRACEAHPNARLVVLCEAGDEGRVRAFPEVEPEAVLRKPIEMNKFLTACERR